MFRVRIINWRQFIFFGLALSLGISITIFVARDIYLLAVTEARNEFRASSALYLDRIRSEIIKGFTATDDFKHYFSLGRDMDERRFKRFINSYSALRENRTLVSMIVEIEGETERLSVFDAIKQYEGREFVSWHPSGEENRTLTDTEVAYYVRFHWLGDVNNIDAEAIDLRGAEVAQYAAINALLSRVRKTDDTVAAIFSATPDKITSQFAQILIANSFELNPTVDLFLMQSIDIAELIKDVEPVAGEFVEQISMYPVLESSIGPKIANRLSISANGAVSYKAIDESQYWVFEKDEMLGNQRWRFAVYANPQSFAVSYDGLFINLLIGFGFTTLLSFGIWSQMRRAKRVTDIVDRRTRALKEAHSELENHYKMLQGLNADVNEARKSAEMANMAKSEFLATMSHELRTPLNAILGFSQILEAETLGPIGDDRYKEYAADIHASGTHLLSIINDILDLAKLEAGKVLIERSSLYINTLVDRVVGLLAHQAEEKGILLTAEISADMPKMFMGDELRLRQILINLVSNAIKFTPKGAVTIRVFPKDFKNGRGGWVLEVQDTGIGIPEEKQSTLFDRFTQVDTALSRRHGGAGLGLAICRELIDRMEGLISVRSTQNVGTTIRVQLPLDETKSDDEDTTFI